MPDFLISSTEEGQIDPLDLVLRLVLALLLGAVVAWIYRKTHKSTEIVSTFPTTLILLSVLIAMVTQVIGGNVARAFSLVGALSIVRFRTVVRDTIDTAYVIFAVVVGMAVGAEHPLVAVAGIIVIGCAMFVMMYRSRSQVGTQAPLILNVRIGIGNDVDTLLGSALDRFLDGRELRSIATAKQGASLDVTYETRLRANASADELIKTLNRIEGVQSVEVQRRGIDDDD